MTQQLAAVGVADIAQHPEDWHMLQKVFAADLDATPRTAAGGGADHTAVNGPQNTPANAPP